MSGWAGGLGGFCSRKFACAHSCNPASPATARPCKLCSHCSETKTRGPCGCSSKLNLTWWGVVDFNANERTKLVFCEKDQPGFTSGSAPTQEPAGLIWLKPGKVDPKLSGESHHPLRPKKPDGVSRVFRGLCIIKRWRLCRTQEDDPTHLGRTNGSPT